MNRTRILQKIGTTITASFLFLTSQVSAEVESRIIGGDIAVEGSWPATVAITLEGLFCGGSLVDERWVVTAAHCLFNQAGQRINNANIIVKAGSVELNSPTMQEILVTNSIEHPQYTDGSFEHDIALLELATPAEAPAAPIAPNPDVPAVGTLATVVGWGITEDSPTVVNELREVEVPIVSNATCRASYPPGVITDGMLCAGYADGGKDACQGDSGGPLMVQNGGEWQLSGVVSFGAGCAQPDKYGVYTRISAYLSWLETYLGTGIGGGTTTTTRSGSGAITPGFLLLLAPLLLLVSARRRRLVED